MLKLSAGEICPHIDCQHRMGCWGAKSDRNNNFECNLLDDYGTIKENTFRSQFDKTGKMEILMD